MKRIVACCVAALLLTGCAANVTPTEPEQAQNQSVTQPTPTAEKPVVTDSAPSAQESESAEPQKLIEITLPADFVGEDATQEALDADMAEADGFESATLNEDGSVTYSMTEAKHAELMAEIAQQIDSSIDELVQSEDYPNIVSIEADSDYTSFTVTLSVTDVGFEETIAVFGLAVYSGMYNAFNGTPVDNITVRFVDESGNLIQEINSADM